MLVYRHANGQVRAAHLHLPELPPSLAPRTRTAPAGAVGLRRPQAGGEKATVAPQAEASKEPIKKALRGD